MLVDFFLLLNLYFFVTVVNGMILYICTHTYILNYTHTYTYIQITVNTYVSMISDDPLFESHKKGDQDLRWQTEFICRQELPKPIEK